MAVVLQGIDLSDGATVMGSMDDVGEGESVRGRSTSTRSSGAASLVPASHGFRSQVEAGRQSSGGGAWIAVDPGLTEIDIALTALGARGPFSSTNCRASSSSF